MQWTQQIDNYCERLDPGYWAEPLNAVTNAGFVLAALILWTRLRGQPAPLARLLTAILALIGIGSYLFHTHATLWAAMADTTPIALFVLVYIYAINRDVWNLRRGPALGLTALFFPYAALTVPLFGLIPGLGSSAGYAPVPLLIAIYAVLLRHHAPRTARGLALGAGLLTLSITFRALDMPLCNALPAGTHYLWHLFNALMLGWMIEVYRRHLAQRTLEGARREG